MGDILGLGTKSQRNKLRHNYKITPTAYHEIINMVSKGIDNDSILKKLEKDYEISLSSSRISQIRKKILTQQLAYYNKDLESKLKKKMDISENMLSIIEHSYKIIKGYIERIQYIDDPKELMIINNIVNTTHRLYSDLVGDMDKRETVSNNIRKAFE